VIRLPAGNLAALRAIAPLLAPNQNKKAGKSWLTNC
jgi:hypothetical protein